jgi:hypothetical protein
VLKILLKPDPEADDPDALQNAANETLKRITGVDNGFDSTRSDADIEAALESWRLWWQRNKDKWK